MRREFTTKLEPPERLQKKRNGWAILQTKQGGAKGELPLCPPEKTPKIFSPPKTKSMDIKIDIKHERAKIDFTLQTLMFS